ncbi:MAG TPA: alkaline phosphatase PhoX [Cytophagaceae bacterium]
MTYLKIFILLFIVVNNVFGQVPFNELDTNYTGEKLIVPSGMKYNIIFKEGEVVVSEKGRGRSKGNHDYTCFIPYKNSVTSGLMYISHETNDTSSIFGDGGGGTTFPLRLVDKVWTNVGPYRSIDFSTVGGTFNNCSGFYTSAGTILTSEEFPPSNNKELYKRGIGFRDTSDYKGMKRWENMGWMVEVDPFNNKALHKNYNMGRFSHEGVLVLPDSMTVYLADDYVPSVFFKFVSNKKNHFVNGQLYAFRQYDTSSVGEWIALPMHIDSLKNIRNIALRKGASAFVRMEWMTMIGGKIYLTETGSDNVIFNKNNIFNGKPANHLERYRKPDNTIDYPHGAILVFDDSLNSIKVHLAGGKGLLDNTKIFSNPDGITSVAFNEKKYLVINEDAIGINRGRVSPDAENKGKFINEIWWLDLDIKNPKVEDLDRFVIGPSGAETTGGTFSPDGKTYFVNIQHPDINNKPPFNRSFTVAITGFNARLIRKRDRVPRPKPTHD